MKPKATDPTLALFEKGDLISAAAAAMLERFMGRWRISGLHAVLETHLMTEAEAADAYASLLGLHRLFNLRHRILAAEAACRIGFRRARQLECLPIVDEEGGGIVELVVADPTRETEIRAVMTAAGQEMNLSVGERSDIVASIDELFPLSAQLPGLYSTLERSSSHPKNSRGA